MSKAQWSTHLVTYHPNYTIPLALTWRVYPGRSRTSVNAVIHCCMLRVPAYTPTTTQTMHAQVIHRGPTVAAFMGGNKGE